MRRLTMVLVSGVTAVGAAAFDCSDAVKARAKDFVENETQFHLGFLPTERSNPITASLEDDFTRSTYAGVECLRPLRVLKSSHYSRRGWKLPPSST